MLDRMEPSEAGDTDALARGVRRVLAEVYEGANHAAPDSRRHEFSFNVLLNALCSVMEAVRRDDPEHLGNYQQMTQLALQDD